MKSEINYPKSSIIGTPVNSPFALLDVDYSANQQKGYEIKNTQSPSKNIKKSALPFTPYQIKPSVKRQHTKSPRPSTIQQDPSKKRQIKSQIISVGDEKGDQPQDSVPLQKIQSCQSQYQDEQYQEKKYFLRKKNRQIKYELDSNGDPPLLYDIGLQPQIIKDKMIQVLKMGEPDYDMIVNPDLSGPIIIALAFGFTLLFSGQLHFGDIYALFLFGNFFMFMLFNFMTKVGTISLYNIMSILGYSLLPMLVLGLCSIFFRLQNFGGIVLSVAISIWSSTAGCNFLQALIKGKKNRRLLIFYPLFLFYLCFAMLVIFE